MASMDHLAIEDFQYMHQSYNCFLLLQKNEYSSQFDKFEAI